MQRQRLRAGMQRIAAHQPWTVWFAVGFILLTVALVFFGPLIAPYDPAEQNLLEVGKAPSAEHWLGTDGLGRDVLSRVLVGAASAVLGPAAVAIGAMCISVFIGITSGYLGGRTDAIIMRAVDFLMALPSMLVAIVVVGILAGGYWAAVATLAFLYVSHDVRIVRGVTLEQRSLAYVSAARVLGIPRRTIMFGHIFRNIRPFLFSYVSLDFSYALVALAGLAYLGLGAAPGTPEWGRMLAENQALLFSNSASMLAPAVLIGLLAISVTLVGDRVGGEISKATV